jgi:hypothetical protein
MMRRRRSVGDSDTELYHVFKVDIHCSIRSSIRSIALICLLVFVLSFSYKGVR